MKKILLLCFAFLFVVNSFAQNIKAYKTETKILQFDSTYTGTVDNKRGLTKWSDEEQTLQFGVEGGSIDVNKEIFDIYTDLNHNLSEGNVVSVVGVSGNRLAVSKTNISNGQSATACIGVVTDNLDGWFVRVTTRGKVRGLNTSSFTEGFPVYASIVDGTLTQNIAAAPDYFIHVGMVEKSHLTDGIIYVDVKISPTLKNLSDVNGTPLTTTGQIPVWDNDSGYFDFTFNPLLQNAITHEPSGFEHPEDVIVNYNSTNRTVTLTGNTTAFWRGDTITALVSGWTSEAHTATTGAWYLYYNGTSFVWSQTPWTFDMVQIAFVNYNQFAIRETHGLMQYQTHKELHETIGTYLSAGGDISDYTPNSTTASDRRPLVSITYVNDEDNQSAEPALTSESYTRFYLTGTNTSNFTAASADIVSLSGNNPYWNEYTGSTWNQTLMANNSYSAVWLVALPVTADAQSQAYRYLWVQPQSNSTTLSTIQALSPSSISLGNLQNLTPEVVFIGKIIIQYTAANWKIISVEKLIGNKINQQAVVGGSYLSVVTTDNTLTGNGTTIDPLKVDTTKIASQYDLTLVIDSTAASYGIKTIGGNRIHFTKSAGTSNHASLSNLSYATAGHTGFAGTGVLNTFDVTQSNTYTMQIKNPSTFGQGLYISTGASGTNPIVTFESGTSDLFRVNGDGTIKMQALPNATKTNVVYYDATTKYLSYGAAPSATDLTFTGTSSPVTLNSSTGTDVTFTAGTNISLSQSGNNLTITNTQSVPADGKITNVTFSTPNLTFTGSNGAFNGSVSLSSLAIAGGWTDNGTFLYPTTTTDNVLVGVDNTSNTGASTSALYVYGNTNKTYGIYSNSAKSGGTGILGYGGSTGIGVEAYATGTGSIGLYGSGGDFDLKLAGSGKIIINAFATAPASATSTGTAGTVIFTADYIYVCTATNTWKRVALSTW